MSLLATWEPQPRTEWISRGRHCPFGMLVVEKWWMLPCKRGDSNLAGKRVALENMKSFAMSTVQSDSIVQSMCGETVPPDKEGLPVWLGNIMATLLQAVGPKGVSFARYSIDYHLLRKYLHVLAEWGPGDES